MATRVKICGITNREDAEAAIAAGADALGFILFSGSKRFIPIEEAIQIVETLPPFVTTVAVTVNAVKEFTNLGWRKQLKNFGVAQLHGEESPQHVKAVSKYLPVIKVFPADVARTITPGSYAVSAFMLDTPSAEHGGTGRVFDWSLATEFKARIGGKPLVLAGGGGPQKFGEGIAQGEHFSGDAGGGG